MSHLRVVVATPLKDEDLHIIESREPRLELIKDDSLLPPMRWAADYEGDPSFHRTPEQEQRFHELIDSADVLYGIPDVKPKELARAIRSNPRLRWVQIMAAGGGSQVKAAGLTQEELNRVIFTTGSGVHAGPLSEFALFGLFAGAKNLPKLLSQKKSKEWSGRWPMEQVSELTILVLGLGHLGREIARKAAALGATVIGVDRGTDSVPFVDKVFDSSHILEAASHANAIVNTLPGTAATNGLVNADVLAALRPGTILASIGRGTVIDEPALIDALHSGQIGFAALDVFAVEPLAQSSPLWDMPNVIVSPHTAANSPHEERLIAELFADNVTRFLDGKPLKNVVNTVEFY
ncbi:D-2-hydroxyacid dehydrogenase [Bifidobacterium sp.]|uniref:D-2-hydroxyacid dehydrogenase n=1 Tax=Bifidobacterium sp. TaxID=41200 RepID=UPI0039EC7557